MTGVLHSVSSSSFRCPRYRLRSFPGCFGPSISTLMCMYFLFMHSQGEMLYMHTNTGQVLCVLLWLPKGFSPSVLATNTTFLGSFPKSSSKFNPSHWAPSEGWLNMMYLSGSFFQLLLFVASFPHANA